MSTKNKVLEVLESNRNEYISGQEIAERLCISRNAVWKAIRTLQEQGHIINSQHNRGYMLNAKSDLLSKEGITFFMPEKYRDNKIVVYKTVDSTNISAKRMALEGERHGAVVLAEKQEAGRGRSGKSFFSPEGTGLYMSMILRPEKVIAKPQLITVAAAVSVCEVIEELTGETPQIKWVNDIFLLGKKICGISTEAVMDFESQTIDHIVLGLGINCTTEQEAFPEEIRDIAGSINLRDVSRNELAAKVAAKILDRFNNLEDRQYIVRYKERSIMYDKRVTFSKDGELVSAKVLDIDDDCGLVVCCDDGREMTLTSGEVSIGSDFMKETFK